MSTVRATLTPTILKFSAPVFAAILAASCGGGAAPDLQTQTDPPVRVKANVTPIGFPGGSIPADAYQKGMWSPVFNWPLIAVHAVLMPDGRVLTYGTDGTGKQTGFFIYDVWDPAACHGGTHVSPEERAAFAALLAWGLCDSYRQQHQEPERYTWWDYRAGNFHKNFGMRIDHLLVTRPVLERVVFSEIDREARKGKPITSDHTPLVIDLDQPGRPFDAGWKGAEARIAARRGA